MTAETEVTQASDASERNGVYLLTIPRSASNLFQTMNAKQPGYQCSGYKLFDAGFATLFKLEKGRWNNWPEEDRKTLSDTYQTGFESLQDEIADAKKKGKQVFIKEHTIFLHSPEQLVASVLGGDNVQPLGVQLRDGKESPHTNPSSLPDRFLLSMQPVFQIRHPALAFPSMMRAQRDVMETSTMQNPRTWSVMNMKHSRAMYDWYAANAVEMKPRVIDADDIMTDPEAVRQLCIETGLDPDAIQYEWEERTMDHPVHKRMLSTIYASKGIVKGLDARNLDIETEMVKWKAEFGDEDAEGLAKYVYAAMLDYEYLLSRRTRAKSSYPVELRSTPA